MDSFRTQIDIKPSKTALRYDSRLLFIGSCFASNIGQYFVEHCLNAAVNPFGVLYNPCSVASSLERLIDERCFNEDDVMIHDGMHHSFYHHSQFNHPDKELYLNNINTSFNNSIKALHEADVLLITLGTSWVYEHKEQGIVVSNCHKYPSSLFKRYMLGVDEIVKRYTNLINAIQALNPQVRIVFTVSPVRHWKDGAHGNQLSKATLLLAIDKLIENYARVEYFPAYEILLDELRDYRFFADDMLHPSQLAIKYIRDRFIESQFDEDGKRILMQIAKLKQASEHRPFNVESDAHQRFIEKQINKASAFQKQYPTIDLKALVEKFINQRI